MWLPATPLPAITVYSGSILGMRQWVRAKGGGCGGGGMMWPGVSDSQSRLRSRAEYLSVCFPDIRFNYSSARIMCYRPRV